MVAGTHSYDMRALALQVPFLGRHLAALCSAWDLHWTFGAEWFDLQKVVGSTGAINTKDVILASVLDFSDQACRWAWSARSAILPWVWR